MFFSRQKILGIDISDRAVKAVVLEIYRQQFKLKQELKIELSAGIIEGGQIKSVNRLVPIWRKISSELGSVDKLAFVIPEEQTFFHRFKILPSQPLDSQAKQEAQSNIPLQEDDLLFAYTLERGANLPQFALLAAVSRQVLSAYQAFFQNFSQPTIFITAPFALLRGIFPVWPPEPVCLVDIGARVTNIIIFSPQGLVYEHTIRYAAGQSFTEKISQVLNIPWSQAEALKKVTEITHYGENTGAAFVLRVVLETIAQEVKSAIEYCHQTLSLKTKNIILTGGSSQLKGLLRYYQSYFSVFISKPYRGGEKVVCQRGLPCFKQLMPEFIIAAGAAQLGGKDDYWRGPCLQVINIKKKPMFNFWQQAKKKAKEQKAISALRPIFRWRLRKIFFAFGLVVLVLLAGWKLKNFIFQPSPEPKVNDFSSNQPQASVNAQNNEMPAAVSAKNKKTSNLAPEPKKTWATVKDLGGQRLNVRAQPNLQAVIIGRLASGQKIEVLANKGQWRQIKLDSGQVGWVYAPFIKINN